MNSPFMVAEAEAFAKRLIASHSNFEDRILEAYELCYSRPPTAAEQELAGDFFGNEADSPELWTQYAQVLLASNELLFVD
jgi:hypothetical protein